MANIAGAQKQIRDIVWNDIASGDVPYVLRDIVQELADSGHTEIREVPWMVVPLFLSAVASLLLGMYPGPVVTLAGMVKP